ncbi:MAG TPA: WbqC family protein [Lysobacter sp.]
MSERIAVLQSNYIPWKGYFDLIHDVDTFIFYDDVQFTRQDWRTRNRVKTANGPIWLSVPAGTDLDRLICNVQLREHAWQKKHWATLSQAYGKTPHFARYRAFFEDVYLGRTWTSLSELNQYLITTISRELLGIGTRFLDSRKFNAQGQKLDRLLDLIGQTGAGTYLSGPAAKDYIDPARFEALGVELVYKDYSGYPEYPQLHPPFEHAVSILDLLFHTGDDAPHYIWGWRGGR